jgi:hypothetical protein
VPVIQSRAALWSPEVLQRCTGRTRPSAWRRSGRGAAHVAYQSEFRRAEVFGAAASGAVCAVSNPARGRTAGGANPPGHRAADLVKRRITSHTGVQPVPPYAAGIAIPGTCAERARARRARSARPCASSVAPNHRSSSPSMHGAQIRSRTSTGCPAHSATSGGGVPAFSRQETPACRNRREGPNQANGSIGPSPLVKQLS